MPGRSPVAEQQCSTVNFVELMGGVGYGGQRRGSSVERTQLFAPKVRRSRLSRVGQTLRGKNNRREYAVEDGTRCLRVQRKD